MNISIRIPAALRGFTGGLTEVVASGRTLGAVLDDMEARYRGVKLALFDKQGRPLRFVAIFVNGVDMRALQGLETPVSPGAEIDIVSAIAGG